jgi:hypothetical protein
LKRIKEYGENTSGQTQIAIGYIRAKSSILRTMMQVALGAVAMIRRN